MAQIVERNKRKYYPEDFIFTDWNSIESYYSELERTEISSLENP